MTRDSKHSALWRIGPVESGVWAYTLKTAPAAVCSWYFVEIGVSAVWNLGLVQSGDKSVQSGDSAQSDLDNVTGVVLETETAAAWRLGLVQCGDWSPSVLDARSGAVWTLTRNNLGTGSNVVWRLGPE
ncbi:hypothetical protein chiPu_0018408 [Chiloscyllium punctatum]|uniref:Uncharacterized protein n=1 Tax=Chiloscyllium punctatum TaxID=137246 RepID=A0A401RN02_CHIPU|nr:hypothetical protein [Chiloscyllium punctatum]